MKNKMTEKLFELAYTDSMTEVQNRNAYEERLKKLRKPNANISRITVIVVDVNGLKEINDSYGHFCGDDAIKTVAKALRDTIGLKADIYRIGGDEFCVLIDDHNTCDISHLISCLRKEEDVYNASSRNIHLQIACGYAVYDSRTDADLDALQKRADQNMYENKKQLKTFSYR